MYKNILKIAVVALVIVGCEEILTVENIEDEKVSLLAPANQVNIETNTMVSFSWEYVDQADEYSLQLAKPNFAAAQEIVLDTLVSKNTFSLDSLKANAYEWRVKALNSGSETGYSVNGFVVE